MTSLRQIRARLRRIGRSYPRTFRLLRIAFFSTVVTSSLVGFVAGAASQQATYQPHLFALGVSFLFLCACAGLAAMSIRLRLLRRKYRQLAAQNDLFADRNWELRDAEERARHLFEAQGDLIVMRDADGRITFANDAYCALAGRSADALKATTFDFDRLEDGAASIARDGARLYDQKVATPCGARWIAWRESRVPQDSHKRGVTQWVGRDVTYRVAGEEALADAHSRANAANQAKSRFLAMVSHEIRTPLNGILGMSGLLLDTGLTPEQGNYARAIKTSGDALMTLVEDVLDFSKIESGRIDLDDAPFDLVRLVEDTAELLAPRAHAKGIEIATFVDDSLPHQLRGDAARLRQVLLNLAGNAIKFTQAGGVAILVDAAPTTGHVRFAVRDTGIGIPADAQARIFEDFEQADSTIARTYGGTGLGLSISDRLVRHMGGTLTLESVNEAGSTFSFTISLTAVEATTPSPAPHLAGQTVLILTHARIEPPLIERRLTHWGAAVTLAHDVQAIAERAWDIILIDHALMPSLPAVQSPRCIVMLSPDDRHDLPALLSAGATDYLIKPLRAASLAARLGEFSAPSLAPQADAAVAPSEQHRALSVLVAEDNDINALLTRALLTKLGHTATVVADGRSAVASWDAARKDTPFDLVLMDVQMPVMDGIAATRAIRAQETGDRITILALTANALADDRAACLAAGMDGFLTKPLDRDALDAALRSIPAISRQVVTV